MWLLELRLTPMYTFLIGSGSLCSIARLIVVFPAPSGPTSATVNIKSCSLSQSSGYSPLDIFASLRQAALSTKIWANSLKEGGYWNRIRVNYCIRLLAGERGFEKLALAVLGTLYELIWPVRECKSKLKIIGE